MCFVRPVEPSDVPQIVELYAEVDELHRQHHPELFPSGRVVRDSARIERALADPQSALLVGSLAGDEARTVSGLLRIVDVQTPEGRILAPRRFGQVDELVVAALARRHGLATALLAAAEEWAHERGLKSLEVTVWAFNQEAQGLYQNAGFDVLRHYLSKPLNR
jgi:ribosomal protein S18 acetylase RimI-like enzyme